MPSPKKSLTSSGGLVQLSLPDFLDQLHSNPGIPLKRKITANDIGGQLLSIISRGLYGNPLDFIREYAQNAVDGRASNVSIRITGRAVTIEDDGLGMTMEDLLEARKVGFSPKSLHENVGFRGIGIYSSFDICNHLVIATKKQGSTVENILEFDFASMRRQLDLGEQSSLEQGVNLTDLISEFSNFRVEDLPDQFEDQHYTRVYLDELNESHFRELIAKPKKLYNYILRNLPIDFHKSFAHKKQITHLLQVHTEAYYPIVVHLEVEGQPTQEISRPAIPDLLPPKYGFIQNSQGDNIAFYWACLTSNRTVISGKVYGDYRGFTYKIRGFSIGDNKKLKEYFGRTGGGTLYERYFGEIHVLDKGVRPNSARDDFEPSEAKTSLEAAVVTTLKQLHIDANREQQIGRADESIANAIGSLSEIEANLEHLELPEVFRTVGNLIEDLGEKVSIATDRNQAQNTLDRAKQLQSMVLALIDKKQPTPFLSPLPGKEDNPLEEQNPPNVEDSHDTSSTSYVSDGEDLPDKPSSITSEDEEFLQGRQQKPDEVTDDGNKTDDATRPREQEYVTLVELFADYGYESSQDVAYILNLIDETLLDVLGYDSESYRAIVSELDQRLTN